MTLLEIRKASEFQLMLFSTSGTLNFPKDRMVERPDLLIEFLSCFPQFTLNFSMQKHDPIELKT